MTKVLVVEDDPVSLKLITSILEKQDIEAICQTAGMEALDYLRNEGTVDLIITDIMMPEMDGLSLLKKLKADQLLKRIPIILCTTLSDEQTVTVGLKLGAIDYITKPIKPDLMLKKINRALKKQLGAVLVVDDEPTIRDLICRVITNDGYRVLSAGSGEEALELFDNNKIAMVLSDVCMTPMSGLTLLEKIKERSPSTPVFLITGRIGSINKEAVFANGADGFISKPFHNTEILAQVRQRVNN